MMVAGGRDWVLMAVEDVVWVGGIGGGFHGSSQTLVVGGFGGRSFHGILRCYLLHGGVGGFQGSARNWLCRGEAGVLMTVPDGDCRGWKGLALMAFPDAGRRGETGVLMAVPDTGSGWVFIAVSDAGCLV